jgi:elongation factor Ts
MAAITASMVNELRNQTGLGMMECKKALTEADGDIAKAIENFRKKGVKTSISERAATEGRVVAGSNGKVAAAVELNCNTDFTAKSEELLAVAELALAKLLANPAADIAADAGVKEKLTQISQKTGENVVLGKAVAHAGDFASHYLYSTAGKGKVAVLQVYGGAVAPEIVSAIGMHVTGARPVALDRTSVPADLVAKEKDIAVEQAKASGKPPQIAEKIAEGKMNAFFAEKVLLEQDFINPEAFKGKVGDMLKSKGATLAKFARIEVGQA